uniref:Uncharacterized protein n=1 Tax=Nephila pilipes TaxID=299642 RepID=A0A8X6NB24_NEPPI|nr:hypothetical protein NPIL_105991 [Nephila pilipes]
MDSLRRYHTHIQSVGKKWPPPFLTLYSMSLKTQEVIKKYCPAHNFVTRSNDSRLWQINLLFRVLAKMLCLPHRLHTFKFDGKHSILLSFQFTTIIFFVIM